MGLMDWERPPSGRVGMGVHMPTLPDADQGMPIEGSLRMGTWHGKGNDPRYTPTTTLETFPFPEGLSPNVPATDYLTDPRAQTIASAGRRLVELRDRWLNPPEWVEWVEEPVAGYPPRPVPRDKKAATALKKRTLTNLYNARPRRQAVGHNEHVDIRIEPRRSPAGRPMHGERHQSVAIVAAARVEEMSYSACMLRL